MNVFEFIVYKRRGKIKQPNGIHEEYFSIFSSGCKQFKSVHVKISSIDAKALLAIAPIFAFGVQR